MKDFAHTRSITIAGTAILLAACGGAEDATSADAWAGTIVDSAGISVVQNPSEGLWGGSSPWSLTEEVSIGGMSATDESQFGMVVAIDIDREGRMYVADQQAQMIRVFSSDGTFERNIGTPGGGPGELGLGVSGVFVDAEGVHIPDVGNFRLAHFSLDGEPMGSDPLDLTQGIPIRWDQHPDGRVVSQLRSAGEGVGDGMTGDEIRTFEENSITLMHLPRGESFNIEGGAPQFRIFEAEPVWDLGEDGRIASGMNSEYRITLHDSDGNPLRIVTLPTERRPVTESDERRLLDGIGSLMVQQGVPAAALDQVLAGMQFADFYPAYAQTILAADGSLWVQMLKTAGDFGGDAEFNPQDLGSNEWDVFDPDGRYLGRMAMPNKFQPIAFLGDLIYGIQRDEFDVQAIVRMRINRGA